MRTLIALLVIVHCLANSNREYAELSDVLAEDEAAPQTRTIYSYSKIPFFALKHQAKRVKAKRASQCKSVCSQRKECRSFSFSAKKKDCLWSKSALTFNGGFSFFSRRQKEGEKKSGDTRMWKYREFVGLMYQSKSWTQYGGQTKRECEKLCDRAKDGLGRRCHGFSYRASDRTCLLSPFGVQYDINYDYFERNPNSKRVMVVKKKVTRKGRIAKVFVKKKIKAPVEVKFQPKKKPVQMSGQYKTQMAVQEGAAKQGAKELRVKQRHIKKSFRAKKKEKMKIKILAQKKGKAKKKKKTNEKAKKKSEIATKKATQKAFREKTRKKFAVLKQKQREASRKKAAAAKIRLAKARAKMQEKMKKELDYKTKRKEINKKTRKHQELNRKKIDGLIRSGKLLAAAERKNKKEGYHANEDAAKEKVVKMQVKGVKGRRHARHKRQYAKFVAKTLQKQLKKRKTDKQVSIAMKSMMKTRKAELAAVLKTLKKHRAVHQLTSLNIAKLKAKANGLQHAINISAKRGKKAPAQEVKLRYTMNNLRAEQHKYAFQKQKLAKIGRDMEAKKSAIKRLDNRMTQKHIGRRRRAGSKKPKKKKKKKSKITPIKSKKKKNTVGVRRRRSKARLTSRFMSDARATSGVAALPTTLPGLPKIAKKSARL